MPNQTQRRAGNRHFTYFSIEAQRFSLCRNKKRLYVAKVLDLKVLEKMLHVSTQKLIEKLLEQTLNGAIDWKEGDDENVLLETEGYIVELKGAPAQLRLSQENGRELELVDQDSLASVNFDEARTYADLIREMTNEAGRHAKGTEAAISTILGAVDAGVLRPKPSMPVSRPVTHKVATEEDTTSTPDAEDTTDETVVPMDAEPTSETQETVAEDTQEAPVEPTEEPSVAPEHVSATNEHQHQDDSTFTFTAPAAETAPAIEGEQEMSEAVGKLVEEINGEETAAVVETPVEAQPATAETEWVAEETHATEPTEHVNEVVEPAPVEQPAEAVVETEEPAPAPVETQAASGPVTEQAEQQPVLQQPTPPEQPAQSAPQESVGFYTPPLSGAEQQKNESIVQDADKLRATPSPFSKVTATGIAVGNGVGTLISGVPQDVQAKTEQHASEVASADAAKETQSEQAADANPQPAPQTDPYKSWS